MKKVPVITFDGPSGVGKGTISKLVARELGWYYLDSGAIYRVLGLAAVIKNYDLDDGVALAKLANELKISFDFDNQLGEKIYLNSEEVSAQVRTMECGKVASCVARHMEVREQLVKKQVEFLKEPGLVADGRDMGTVIFKDAPLKFFLDAKPEIRAQRRLAQLKSMGINGSIERLLLEISERDKRDRQREHSPLVPAKDAIILDTGELSPEQALRMVLDKVAATNF